MYNRVFWERKSKRSHSQNFHYSIIVLLFSSVQLLSRVRLFATPWIAARQASLSITNSRSSLKLMSIELVMPSSILFLLCLIYILNFIIGIVYRKRHSIGRVWCHSWFQAITDGLSMYPLWIRGDYCNLKSSRLRQQNYFTVSVGQKSSCCFAGSSCSGFLRSLYSHCTLGMPAISRLS